MPRLGTAKEAASVPSQPRKSGLSSPAASIYPVSPAKAPEESRLVSWVGCSLCLLYSLRHGATTICPGRGTRSSVPNPVRVRPSRAQEPLFTRWLWWGVDTKALCSPGLLDPCVGAAPLACIALSTGEGQTQDPLVPRSQPLPGL